MTFKCSSCVAVFRVLKHLPVIYGLRQDESCCPKWGIQEMLVHFVPMLLNSLLAAFVLTLQRRHYRLSSNRDKKKKKNPLQKNKLRAPLMQFNLFSHFSWNKVLEKQSHKVPKMVKKEERKKKEKEYH